MESRPCPRFVISANGLAPEFHELFPTSDLFLLPAARHLVQMDEPEEVVRLIFSTPAKG